MMPIPPLIDKPTRHFPDAKFTAYVTLQLQQLLDTASIVADHKCIPKCGEEIVSARRTKVYA
jgi:hypothetical protein